MAALRARLQAGIPKREGCWGIEGDDVYRRCFEQNDWKLVESINAFRESFWLEFWTEEIVADFYKNIRSGRPLCGQVYLQHMTSESFKQHPSHVKRCLGLIEETSKADYDGSGKKWSRAKKKKEMLLPDMKYLLWWQSDVGEPIDPQADHGLIGFASFMITYEDGHEVIYIYEIHFEESYQGRGYGGHLMDVVEAIGREVGVEKAMLTVFNSNRRAVKWYHKRGYDLDEYSPGARKFRDGTIKEPKYLILSKELKADEGIGRRLDPECPLTQRQQLHRRVEEARAATATEIETETERALEPGPPAKKWRSEG